MAPWTAVIRFHRATWWKVVAIIYTGGTVAHVLRLIVRFRWEDMPFAIDWALVLLGPYGAAGLLLYARDVEYRGKWERLVHWLIVVHLLLSIGLHVWILAVHSHQAVAGFPYGYSYFGVLYFGVFAWRSWTLRSRLPDGRTAETSPAVP